jgi:hypothetical protein
MEAARFVTTFTSLRMWDFNIETEIRVHCSRGCAVERMEEVMIRPSTRDFNDGFHKENGMDITRFLDKATN